MKNKRQGNKSTCFAWDLFPCLFKKLRMESADCGLLGLRAFRNADSLSNCANLRPKQSRGA